VFRECPALYQSALEAALFFRPNYIELAHRFEKLDFD